MLILTRKVGETLVIGDEVEVTVLSMKGNQIRLGVKAPKEVAVHREEIARKLNNSRDNRSVLLPPSSQGCYLFFSVIC